MTTKNPNIKIAVIGGGGVGKSALTVKYVQNIFIDKYDPTIEDSYRKHTVINGKAQLVEILDTAGTEQFTVMRDLYIKNADGIILVYSITSRETIRELDNIYDQINMINPSIPLMLCGNKCDLEDDRVVETMEGQEYANEYGADFMETSSALPLNVEEVFNNLLTSIDANMKNTEVLRLGKKRKCCIIM
jgi:small GTP-binding protein